MGPGNDATRVITLFPGGWGAWERGYIYVVASFPGLGMRLHVLGAGSVHGRTIEWPETLFADVEGSHF